MKEKVLENKKGITLIALVITIIVMLILVAVTINIAVNGGLFSYAGKATSDTEKAKQDELKIAEGQIEVDGKKYDSPEDFIAGIESGSEKFSAIYTETKEYKETINGVETTTAWIPNGFAVGTSEGINKVADGLVIQDDKGNQFVWIPVSLEGNTTAEKEASFDAIRTTKNNSSYSEPKTGEETDYNNMRTRVINKGGFYIARYEAGFTTGRLTRDSSVSTIPLSKKGAYPYNVVNWSDAKSASQRMYNDSAKYGVKSTLCYGVQWDAMLSFLGKTSETDSTAWGNYYNAGPFDFAGEYYKYGNDEWKSDTTSKAKDTNMLLQTGASDRNSLKNIYDVAGNVCEWTMEAGDSSSRVSRGGGYGDGGDVLPASSRIRLQSYVQRLRLRFSSHTLFVVLNADSDTFKLCCF